MNCIRCRGPMIPERDKYGSFATCLNCGYVAYESVIEEWRAREELSGKLGKVVHAPTRYGKLL